MPALFAIPVPTPEPGALIVWSVLAVVGIGIGWWRSRKVG